MTRVHPATQSRMARLVRQAGRLLTAVRRSTDTAAIITRRQVLSDLRPALAAGDVRLYYQPKLCLRSGSINGLEGLLRWNHRRLGAIPPSTVIAALEMSKLLFHLTSWVLVRAIADQARMKEAGHDLIVYVNISSILLADDRFIDLIRAVAKQANGNIGLEITETAFILDHDVAAANLAIFVSLGFKVSIDDYGSGLSSLAYLKEFPAAELKIDRMFVSSLTSCHRNPLIVRSTIELAHALGMKVVAEGVESLATLALLRAMGCDTIQGFIISPALPVDDLPGFIQSADYRRLMTDSVVPISASKAFWSREHHEPELGGQPFAAAS